MIFRNYFPRPQMESSDFSVSAFSDSKIGSYAISSWRMSLAKKDVKSLFIIDLQTATEWVGDCGFLAACSNFSKISLWDIEKAKIVQKYLYEIDKPKDDKNNSKK